MNKQKLLETAQKHKALTGFMLNAANKFPLNNRIRLPEGNELICKGLMKNCRIKVKGSGNRIIIGELARLVSCSVTVSGNNNTVTVGDRAYMETCEFCLEDDGNKISVGKRTVGSGGTHLAAIEGTRISIGERCLLSAGVTVRTGDSHSITDAATGERCNPSADVTVQDHVWIGNGATILKGVTVHSDCIIGTRAVVSRSTRESGCVLAGNPAKVVKTGRNWDAERKK